MKRFSHRAVRIAALAVLAAAPRAAGAALEIEVLSNRPDLISSGDVLVEVVLPQGTPPSTVVLLANGGLAQGTHGVDAEGRSLARVTGLNLGSNVLTALLPDGSEAT